MDGDALDAAAEKIAAVRKSLNRANGTTGVINSEPKLEGILDVLDLLATELRRVRDGEQTIQFGGLHIFDEQPPQV